MEKAVSKTMQDLMENGSPAEITQQYKEDPDDNGQTILHHAAKHGRSDLVQLIITRTPEVNQSNSSPGLLRRLYKKSQVGNTTVSILDAQDKEGNTPLHLATENNHVQVIQELLGAGASSSILNGVGQGPIHVAVVHNRTECLMALCKHPSVDVNLTGNKGVTAMHVAAFKDHHECAQILLDHGSRFCKPCEIGMPAVHVATLYGSEKTLQVIMDDAELKGIKQQKVVRLQDVSQNSPLHTAVSGGDIGAVKMCLRAGVQISAVQHDKLTPVHLAAQQGNLEMIRAMLYAQPENREKVLEACDLADMTPLHKAALCDKAAIAQYLLDQGADIDALDRDGMSPLLLAAQKGAWETVEVLLKNKADTDIHDVNNSNVLHLIIKNGGRPEDFGYFLNNNQIAKLANEQDEFGCTPLHYASEKGQLKTVLSLIDRGAVMNAKNNNRESPLHFAARNGRNNTCRQLLDGNSGKNTINETNADGLTALHVAAQGGHTQVVQLLLQRGACVQKDRFGNTALHLAVEAGSLKTVRTILNVEGHLINEINKAGDTCLHIAARTGQAHIVTYLMSNKAEFETNYANEHFLDVAIQNRHNDVLAGVVSHDSTEILTEVKRWDEAMTPCSKESGRECPMIGLIKNAPEICQMVLDRCISTSKDDPGSSGFHHTYDFRFLDGNVDEAGQHNDGTGRKPLYSMNAMVNYNRVTCLSHPVCLGYLKMKWRAYGIWYWAVYLLLYGIFISALTTYVTSYNDLVSYSYATNNTVVRYSFHELPTGRRCVMVTILVFSALGIIKEISQIVQQRIGYIMEGINLLEWVLYITCIISVLPFLLDGNGFPARPECTAVAIFLAWFNLLHFIQRFDLYGIYVVMFLEILKTLVQVTLVFSFLLIAFGLAFYVLMYSDKTGQFSKPSMSVMTVIIMLLSNIEFKETWVDDYIDGDPETLQYAAFSFLLLALFTLLVPILLMNLLIGLAIGDIEGVQKNAGLKRLAMQVALHTDLEGKLPVCFLKYVHRSTWTVYPKGAQYFFMRTIQKVMGTGNEDYAPKDDEAGHDTLMYQELFNQKQRLKTIQAHLDRQYDLMRLVVQKMEIRTETDDQEEADHLIRRRISDCIRVHGNKSEGIRWTDAKTRLRMLKHAAHMIGAMRPRSTKKRRRSSAPKKDGQ